MAGTVYPLRWLKNQTGTRNVVEYAEGTAQTFKKGDFVVFDRSDDALKASVDTDTVVTGVALKDATGTAGELIPVLLLSADDLFVATMSDAGANTTAIHSSAKIGDAYSWIKSTETSQITKTVADIADTTNEWLIMIELDSRDAESTAGGRGVFRIDGSKLGVDASTA